MMPKAFLIFAYYSFKDPVFQSAVLPYFIDLFKNNEVKFILLTFEQQRYKLSRNEVLEIKKELLAHNIIWYQSYWHSGRFKIIKKFFDFVWAILYSGFLVLKFHVKGIYSEGFPGAIIAHHLSKFFSIPHIIHTYEPHTDYMVEAGVWSEKSWEAILLRKYEIKVAKGASYIFTGTTAMVEKLNSLNLNAEVSRVPSCVDLSLFKYSHLERESIRKKFDINENECVITYLGKFGGMYMEEEIFDFFKVCEAYNELSFKYLILTPDAHDIVLKWLNLKNINKAKFIIRTLKKEEVSKYLSASDFGLVPVRQYPGKRYCSPIKDGEYWACGLPILIPKGISDDYLFADEHDIGIVIENMSEGSMENTAKKMKAWLDLNAKEEVVKRCRAFVEDDRSVEKYKEKYRYIFLKM